MPQTLRPGPAPKAAINYLKAKELNPAFSHKDVWQQEHAHSFTVANLMNRELLGEVQQTLIAAQREGLTLEQWSATIEGRMQEAGWWGEQEVVDPLTGLTELVQTGSPRRLKRIYQTNISTARDVGKWQRIQRNKELRPYLLYLLGPSAEHRPEHEAWEGIMLPVDDDWWNTHAPRNGWGCNCQLRQISQRQFDDYQQNGVPISKPRLNEEGRPTGQVDTVRVPVTTTAPPIETREVFNPRTGQTVDVPVGIDAGWAYNPGAGRSGESKQRVTQAQTTLTTALQQPLPPASPPQLNPGTGAFSTHSKFNAGAINAALAEQPNGPQREALNAFAEAHGLQALLLSKLQMGNNKQSRAIAPAVHRFIGSKQPFTTRRSGGTNGFTRLDSHFVVVKVAATDQPQNINAKAIRRAVVSRIKSGYALGGSDAANTGWSMSQAMKESGAAGSWLITLIHEIGHLVHARAGSKAPPMNWRESYTRYGSTNPFEWHAEHFVAWYFAYPELLESQPEVAKYFTQLIETATAATPVPR